MMEPSIVALDSTNFKSYSELSCPPLIAFLITVTVLLRIDISFNMEMERIPVNFAESFHQ